MDNIRVSVEVPTTRVYAHVAAETQVALYDPFTNKKRGALDGKYQFNKPIATIDDNAFLEVCSLDRANGTYGDDARMWLAWQLKGVSASGCHV